MSGSFNRASVSWAAGILVASLRILFSGLPSSFHGSLYDGSIRRSSGYVSESPAYHDCVSGLFERLTR